MNKILKAKIVEKFGTQSEFSRIINKNEAIISRTIHGYHNLPTEERMRWAVALDCDDPAKLFYQSGR